jgi:hypothetical protein
MFVKFCYQFVSVPKLSYEAAPKILLSIQKLKQVYHNHEILQNYLFWFKIYFQEKMKFLSQHLVTSYKFKK